ncbi:HutD family protein [Acetobacter sp. DsW_063]|uniref:HutD/Ves family protein n=1 Tax=Acetobacter sp. DsW_063 TaxID=1514894 RepID=UPI000A38466B|nr:HutD family protein [Acetobacter sp. DsW_063]
MTILRIDEIESSPWKNGGGVTREIAVARDDDERVLWRLSVADIARDGPFSSFEQTDRSMALLNGSGLDLIFFDSGNTLSLDRRGTILRYPGAPGPLARLRAGPCRAVNFMNSQGATPMALTVFREPEFHRSSQFILIPAEGAWLVNDGQEVVHPGSLLISRNGCAVSAAAPNGDNLAYLLA